MASSPRNPMGDSDHHNTRGIELADRGWLDEAMTEFRKAIELDPKSVHARDNLGTVLAEKGRHLDALIEYVEACKLEPDNPTVHHYLACFLASHGSDLAVAQYRRALELEYDFPDAHLNLAMALSERGELEEALAELDIAHVQAPDDEHIEHEMACCLIDLERYPKAIEHLKHIIKIEPEHIEAYVDLGIAYTAQGFYAQAEEVLKQALKIDENDFTSHYHLAALYASWGRSDDAVEHLEIAARHDRERLRTWVREDKLFDTIRQEERCQELLA